MWKRIGNKKVRKSGNGNIFQNLIKIVVNLFGQFFLTFCYAADPEIFSCMGQFFFLQRRRNKTQISLATYNLASNWLVTQETSPCVTPGPKEKYSKLG